MPIDFKNLMSGKSDESLQEYIIDPQRYTPEAIRAAISELEKRGYPITITEQTHINQVIEQKAIEENNSSDKTRWTKNIVVTEDAPLLYSEKVVWVFSILFSTLSGALLLAANLRSLKNKKGSAFVTVFGIVYTLLSIIAINYLAPNHSYTGSTYLFGALGGYILNKFFWPRYIGDLKYRTRKFIIPLVIWIAITCFFWRYLYLHTKYK